MILYLDTSSLAKLYIEEVGTADVQALVADARVAATSDVAYPEMRTALARRHRDGSLSAAHFRAAKRALDADWPSYVAVTATSALCREAGSLAERYRLRGFDSIHLASFIEIGTDGGRVDSGVLEFRRGPEPRGCRGTACWAERRGAALTDRHEWCSRGRASRWIMAPRCIEGLATWR